MKSNKQLYIDCLVTALKKQAFSVEPSSKVFLDYLDLTEDRQAIEKKLRKKYEGVSKKSYEQKVDLDELKKEKNEMISSFKRIANDIDIEDTLQISFQDYSKKKFGSVFNFYIKITGQIRDKPAEIYEIRKNILISLENSIRKIAEKILQISLSEKIQDALKFEERYNPDDLIIKKKVADACWDIYEKNKNITKKGLLGELLVKYYISKYEIDSPQEAEKKIIKTAKQWIRDAKRNKGIIIE